MTRHPTPRLALAMLERFVPDSPSLTGDISEEFERRQSRTWLWWQVLAAIATTRLRRPDQFRPLQLVDLQPTDAQERSRRMSLRFPAVNLTASPLYGVGGLGLVTLALLLTVVMPGAWWVLLASILCGIVLGVGLIARHRSKMGSSVGSGLALDDRPSTPSTPARSPQQ
jgi:hypothetical protein